ncbi:MAG TPA: regulatory iron-sulfur-containing complex subunit RicT [bacterium]
MTANFAKIRFRECGKLHDAEAQDLKLGWNDKVIVEYDNCLQVGTVLVPPAEREIEKGGAKILRTLTSDDKKILEDNKNIEKEAYLFCREKIEERNMKMRLVQVYAFFDKRKIMFYFTAENRIDFRELVKDLAKQYKTRIEMRQIGIRDQTRITGGLGYCGRILCCASVIKQFEPVPVCAAKEQNLSLNPTKISGLCGRLMCCIGYESETYKELLKKFPKIGTIVKTTDGTGEVISISLFKEMVTLRLEDGTQKSMSLDKIPLDNKQTVV